MVERGEAPRVGIIALRGDLDCAMRDSIDGMLAPLVGTDIAILSFADVTFCDSTVLRALAHLHARMKKSCPDPTITIVAPSPTLRRVLEICGLDKIFAICDTMIAATHPLTDRRPSIVYMGSASGITSAPEDLPLAY